MRLQLDGVARYHGADPVLEHVNLTLGPRSKVGVVGPNGIGKSTLLRIIAGLEAPDAGSVHRAPPDLTAGYLPQEADARTDETLLAYLNRRTGIAAAEEELQRNAASLALDETAADAYTAALERFLALGGGDLVQRARAVCGALALPVELGRPLEALSGGEQARAALAAVLLSRFDVLLLDEPTNDLDFDGLERLERFLHAYGGALVVVSHDRAFLDRTVTRIAEIEPRGHRLREWAGGWSAYAEARSEARDAAYAALAEAQAEQRRLTELLSRRRTEARQGGATLATASGGADRRGTNALTSKVQQAKRRLERLHLPEKPFELWELRLELRAGAPAPGTVVRLHGAVAERGAFRLGPLDLDVEPGERLAVTGRNGSGKSTLLAMLLGDLPLVAGARTIGRRTVPGAIGQDRFVYASSAPLLDVFGKRTGLAHVDGRTLLAKFGLGAHHVRRPCQTLSPGERTRAHLAELQANGVNLLVLDEPTNHLDLEAIEQLEAALAGYDGAAIVVSHDRQFLETIRPTREVSLGR